MVVLESDVTLRAVMSYVWVGLGSAIGGMSRYWCSGVAERMFGDSFPWGTVFVNITGSLAIGFVATIVPHDHRVLSPEIRDLLMVGLLGGYTTFSAFSLQTLTLAREGQFFPAVGNVLLTVTACLVAVWVGHTTALAIRS